ncbi:substrate-binding periplasmic protein [Pseudomonas sp. SP16.1]|uniref:substrate-binding periplasmic protein n=1 Tax=Pseudomonas sp. SP16.1 TaxID=3458854 RepID=UPI004045AF2B
MAGQWRLGLLLGLVLSGAVAAAELRLVTGDDYAPFTGKNLPGGGMLSLVVRAALAERGLSSTLDWQPWNRGYLKTLRGDYDAAFPYVRSAEREANFLYSAPLYVTEQHLFSRAEDSIELQDLSRLNGRRLCYPLGWQPPVAIQQLIDRGVLQRHSPLGLKECARLLLLQRDDLFLAGRDLGESALRSTGAEASQFHRSMAALGSSTLHLIVPRAHPRAAELIAEFDRGLAALHASGEYRRLLERYLQQAAAELSPAAP